MILGRDRRGSRREPGQRRRRTELLHVDMVLAAIGLGRQRILEREDIHELVLGCAIPMWVIVGHERVRSLREIGREWGRERVCEEGEITVVAVALKKKNKK